VDKYGKISLKEARWFEEEEGGESYGSTSFENTPSPQSAPSVERSTSGSSSIYPAAEDHNDINEVTPIQSTLNTTTVDEVTQLAPSKPQPLGPLESAGPTAVQPNFVPGKPGGPPPPPDGRFFNNPLNLRAIITGSSDGYRSPGPPSRLDTLSPLRYLHGDRLIPGGGPPGLKPMEGLRSPFSAPHPLPTQPSDGPGLGMEYGNGRQSAPSSSSVLPAELIAYNDLMMDIGTAQCLGVETQEPALPAPFANPSMPTNDGWDIDSSGSGTNGYQWQEVSHNVLHDPPQTMSPFGHLQQGQPSCGVGYMSAQQVHTNSLGQWPAGGITDYK